MVERPFINESKFTRYSPLYKSLPSRFDIYRGKNASEEAELLVPLSDKRQRRCVATRRKRSKSVSTINEVDITSNKILEDEEFGLSTSLPTDSMQIACGFYESEPSDGNQREFQNIAEQFRENRLFSRSLDGNDINNFPKEGKELKKYVCNSRYSPTLSKINSQIYNWQQDDEAINALSELDAVLNIHETSQLRFLEETDINVEDCLLDLDSYLNEMDDSIVINECEDIKQSRNSSFETDFCSSFGNRTLPLIQNRIVDFYNAETKMLDTLKRDKDVRRTIHTIPSKDSSVSEEPAKVGILREWRRNSMSKIATLKLPNDANSEENRYPIVDNNYALHNPMTEEITRSVIENDDDDYNPNGGLRTQILVEPSSFHRNGVLTQDNILQSLLVHNSSEAEFANRPRQLGRRAEGYLHLMSLSCDMSRSSCNSNICFMAQCDQRRPLSAPVCTAAPAVETSSPELRPALYIGSEPSSVHTSRNNSPITVDSSSDSICTMASINAQIAVSSATTGSLQPDQLPSDPDRSQIRNPSGINSKWPHSFSRTLALMCCTLGIFNISRFAVLTIHYGGNFILQFLLLSAIFGIPLFWLQMCFGAKIRSGPISMWKISPICKGIGIGLVTVHCLMAIYSTVILGWILIFLRDSIPSNKFSSYRWQDVANLSKSKSKLGESVANYFNFVVLQRLQITNDKASTDVRFRVNDRLAFSLAILWAAVFLILCKGLKSFGKFLFIIGLVPLVTLVCVTFKFLHAINPLKLQNIFTTADIDDFLINSKTWTAAAQETFLTWGLLGVSVIAVSSRTCNQKTWKTSLRRDAILSVLTTLTGLSMATLLGLCCMHVLTECSYVYVPASFESPGNYVSVFFLKDSPQANILSFPPKWVPHYSSFVGEIYRRPGMGPHYERASGYQSLRFLSELFPAVAALSGDAISWTWSTATFASFALFGLAQLCVMWKPISTALGDSTSSILLSCITGLLLTIPFTTEVGIYILYFMDLLLGGSWFVPLLWTAQIFGVFLIRGRPYNGDDLVNDLRMSTSMSAFLALSWNVLLPIGLTALAIIDYKTSQSNQFFYWRGKSYFSDWARKVGGLTQVGFLLLVPVVAIIQIYRYLTNGPPDFLERIKLLYRPQLDPNNHRINNNIQRNNNERNVSSLNNNSDINNTESIAGHTQDAPPKYTPPPSYTTATGARLAKIFRHSIRRSVRRILGEHVRSQRTSSIERDINQHPSLPPDYATIHIDASSNIPYSTEVLSEVIEICERPSSFGNTCTRNSLSLGRNILSHNQYWENSCQRPSSAPRVSQILSAPQRCYTAEDVVSVLRSSMRSGIESHVSQGHQDLEANDDEMRITHADASVENLLLNAEPIGQSQAIDMDNAGHFETTSY